MVAKARRNVISHFMLSNAVRAADAQSWLPDRHIEPRVLARLVRRGASAKLRQTLTTWTCRHMTAGDSLYGDARWGLSR